MYEYDEDTVRIQLGMRRVGIMMSTLYTISDPNGHLRNSLDALQYHLIKTSKGDNKTMADGYEYGCKWGQLLLMDYASAKVCKAVAGELENVGAKELALPLLSPTKTEIGRFLEVDRRAYELAQDGILKPADYKEYLSLFKIMRIKPDELVMKGRPGEAKEVCYSYNKQPEDWRDIVQLTVDAKGFLKEKCPYAYEVKEINQRVAARSY